MSDQAAIMYANSHSHLYIEDVGRGNPIILLHGFGESSYSWRHLIPILSRHYRIIAIDLKGFGRSYKPNDDKYSVHDQAHLIYNFIERLHLNNITMIGHSYGGGVALATTLLLIHYGLLRIDRMVLISTIAYEQKLPIFISLLRTPFLGRLGLSLFSPELQIKAILKLAYYDDSRIPYESVIEYAKPLHTPEGRYAILKTAEQLIPGDIDELFRRYESITMPVLIIWGDNDRIVPIDGNCSGPRDEGWVAVS